MAEKEQGPRWKTNAAFVQAGTTGMEAAATALYALSLVSLGVVHFEVVVTKQLDELDDDLFHLMCLEKGIFLVLCPGLDGRYDSPSAFVARHHRIQRWRGTFNRDANGNRKIGPGEDVSRPPANGGAGMDVHGIIDAKSRPFGQISLNDSRDDGGLLSGIDGTKGQTPGRVHEVGVSGDAGQTFSHTLEATDRQSELFTYHGVGAGRTRRWLRDAGTPC